MATLGPYDLASSITNFRLAQLGGPASGVRMSERPGYKQAMAPVNMALKAYTEPAFAQADIYQQQADELIPAQAGLVESQAGLYSAQARRTSELIPAQKEMLEGISEFVGSLYSPDSDSIAAQDDIFRKAREQIAIPFAEKRTQLAERGAAGNLYRSGVFEKQQDVLASEEASAVADAAMDQAIALYQQKEQRKNMVLQAGLSTLSNI